jgi:hypothetical protein
MTITQNRVLSGAILAVFTLITIVPFTLAQDPVRGSDRVWGDRYKVSAQARILARKPGPHGENPLERLKHWNEIAINATGLDHTPLSPGEDRIFGQQLGPGRASRAMAIVHIAIFEAINAMEGDYESYAGIKPVHGHMSMDAAIAKAACNTLSALFSSQSASFQQLLDDDMNEIPNGPAKDKGFDLGRKAAAAVLAMRTTDGSVQPEVLYGIGYIASNQPGFWRQDPISQLPIALGVHWGDVRPFVLQSTSQFRVPPPPAVTSPEYAAAYNEVKRLGGDGIHTPTDRTPGQTEIGLFWAYDGTPSLCAPPRLYNQITMKIAALKHSDVVATARLLALVNTALADAGTSSWESKFYYNFWRPITGIRESDAGTGPSLLGDGNSATIGDPNFWPLGAPASNLTGPNFTPPFPAYPSGHATFGGALFETLRNFYHTDHIAFDFTSDEFNGVTVDSGGNVRELKSRHFATLSQAEEENGQSRIYLGIHWSFDKTAGIAQGRKVADYVFAHAFTPRQ